MCRGAAVFCVYCVAGWHSNWVFWIYTHTHTNTHTHTHLHTHTYTHTYTHIHKNTHIHTQTYTHKHKHTHTQTHAYTHTHTELVALLCALELQIVLCKQQACQSTENSRQPPVCHFYFLDSSISPLSPYGLPVHVWISQYKHCIDLTWWVVFQWTFSTYSATVWSTYYENLCVRSNGL